MNKNKDKLMIDANIYGLSFLSDGATVKKIPLMNFLMIVVHCPAAVLDIMDCTDWMLAGGVKNATYIATIARSLIKKIDPMGMLVDLLMFDGVGNVQKAGRILNAWNPWVTCIHGAEHVMALDLPKHVPVINHLIHIHKWIYGWFGAGSHHKAYAIFQSKVEALFSGKKFGLLRTADNHMGGYFIALCRQLLLKNAHEQTVFDDVYMRSWPKMNEKLETLIKTNEF